MRITVEAKDVRGEAYDDGSSVQVCILYKECEADEAQHIRDLFSDMEVWFKSDFDAIGEAIIVLWQGETK